MAASLDCIGPCSFHVHFGCCARVQKRIIMDTGCGHNIVSEAFVHRLALPVRRVPKSRGHSFQGVSGVTTCIHQVDVEMRSFGRSDSFWVTQGSPALASVGKRIDDGCSFVWPAGGTPYFITPSGQRVGLVVDKRIPYYDEEDPRCAPVAASSSDFVVPQPSGAHSNGPAVATVANSVHRHVLVLDELVPPRKCRGSGGLCCP